MLPDATREKVENIIRGIVTLGRTIIAQQPAISYAQAIAQAKRLKENSKVSESSKKSKKNN
jgi:hypothetical protein